MWKVKRMNTARIVVLTIAIGAGGIAAYLASGSDKPAPVEPTAQLPTVEVLLASYEAPKEQDGTNTLGGKTATVEIKPEQAETLARARQSGTLSLALRSIADASAVDPSEYPASKRGESVNVVRYGVASPQ